MNCHRCDRPATVKGYCRGHYNARRTKWIRAGKWQSLPSAVGVTRRLRALVALGYTQNELCRRSGLNPSTVSHLIRASVNRTAADTARRVGELYDELSMTPGPSSYDRNRARKLGWAPPLAWDDDDLDNPDAKPELGQDRPITFGEKYAELRDLGYRDDTIAERLGVKPESLDRQLMRHGIGAAS